MRILLIVTLIAALLSSCATTAPMTPGKPLEVDGSVLGRTYKQDGKVIDRNDIILHLKQDPATAGKASAATTWEIISIIPASVGGFMIGYYAVSNKVTSEEQTTGLLLGAGFALAGIGCGIYSESLLSDAVGIYNQNLAVSGSKKKQGMILPAFSPTILYASQAHEAVPGIAAVWRLP